MHSSQTPPLQGQPAPIRCPRKPWTGRVLHEPAPNHYVESISRRLGELGFQGEVRLLNMPRGLKDLNDLHQNTENFVGELSAVLAVALVAASSRRLVEGDWTEQSAVPLA